jgi:hypothetical protein
LGLLFFSAVASARSFQNFFLDFLKSRRQNVPQPPTEEPVVQGESEDSEGDGPWGPWPPPEKPLAPNRIEVCANQQPGMVSKVFGDCTQGSECTEDNSIDSDCINDGDYDSISNANAYCLEGDVMGDSKSCVKRLRDDLMGQCVRVDVTALGLGPLKVDRLDFRLLSDPKTIWFFTISREFDVYACYEGSDCSEPGSWDCVVNNIENYDPKTYSIPGEKFNDRKVKLIDLCVAGGTTDHKLDWVRTIFLSEREKALPFQETFSQEDHCTDHMGMKDYCFEITASDYSLPDEPVNVVRVKAVEGHDVYHEEFSLMNFKFYFYDENGDSQKKQVKYVSPGEWTDVSQEFSQKVVLYRVEASPSKSTRQSISEFSIELDYVKPNPFIRFSEEGGLTVLGRQVLPWWRSRT